MPYSLAAKFCSEAVGMACTIFLGEAILANELLPSTKGHGMGFLAVAVGFGLAFGVSIIWFGFISAHLNPAMFFFLAILGKLEHGWKEFIVGSLGDFVGAFCGACLVYLYFAPHFWTVPLPPDFSGVATLLEGPEAMADNAGRLASAYGPTSRKPENNTFGKELKRARKSLFGGQGVREGRDPWWDSNGRSGGLSSLDSSSQYTPKQEAILEKMELRRRHRVKLTSLVIEQPLLPRKQRSVTVADVLHQHDPGLGMNNSDGRNLNRHSVQVAGMLHMHDAALETGNTSSSVTDLNLMETTQNEVPAKEDEEQGDNNANDTVLGAEKKRQNEQQKLQMAAYKAALEADAHAKLSIFGTRPAMFNRFFNFMQEVFGTIMLVWGVEMFNLRLEIGQASTGVPKEGPLIKALMVSLYITVLILGLGGTTGLAVNPARDMGPRLAHALLPIPGKGSSEWHYGLVVPLCAPFVGAAIGAVLYKAIEELHYSSGGAVEE